jgi:hypothetical protein
MAATIDVGIPLRNANGYPDPTCYKALKEIQRAEYGYRSLIYICSPYSGDIGANVELARRFSAFAVTAPQILLAPHLHYPQFMDDTDPDARELAMFFNRILLSKCEQLWTNIGRVSAGVKTCIAVLFLSGRQILTIADIDELSLEVIEEKRVYNLMDILR